MQIGPQLMNGHQRPERRGTETEETGFVRFGLRIRVSQRCADVRPNVALPGESETGVVLPQTSWCLRRPV